MLKTEELFWMIKADQLLDVITIEEGNYTIDLV